jgi:hypothetical protein
VEAARQQSPDTAASVLHSLIFPDHVSILATWYADPLRLLYRSLFSGYADYKGPPKGKGATQKMRDEIAHWLDSSPEAVEYYQNRDEDDGKEHSNVAVDLDKESDGEEEEEEEEQEEKKEVQEDEQNVVNAPPGRSLRRLPSRVAPPAGNATGALPPPPRSRKVPPASKRAYANAAERAAERAVASPPSTPVQRGASSRVPVVSLHAAAEELSESEGEDMNEDNEEYQRAANVINQFVPVSHARAKSSPGDKQKGKRKKKVSIAPTPVQSKTDKAKKAKKNSAFSLHDTSGDSASDSSSSSSSSSDDSDSGAHAAKSALRSRLSAHAHPKPLAAHVYKRVEGKFYKTFQETVHFEKEGNRQQCLALCFIIDQMIREGLGKDSLAVEAAVRRLIGVQSADLSGDWNYCSELEIQGNSQSFLPGDMLKHIITRTSRLYALQQKHAAGSGGGAFTKKSNSAKKSYSRQSHAKSADSNGTKSGASSSHSGRSAQNSKESSKDK